MLKPAGPHAESQGVRSAIAALLWLVAAASLAGCDSTSPDEPPADADATASPATRSTGYVGRPIVVGKVSDNVAPVSLAVRNGRLWAVGAGELREIDTRRGRAAGRPHRVPRYAAVLESGLGALWAVDQNGGHPLRIDGARVRRSPVTQVPARGVAVSSTGLWVASPTPRGARIARLDPATLRPTASVRVSFPVIQIAAAGGRVWMLDQRRGRLVGLGGPKGEPVANTSFAGHPRQVVARGDWLWAFMVDRNGLSTRILRLDPRSGKRAGPALRVPGDARALAAEGDRAWIAEPGFLHTFDIGTGRQIGEPLPIGSQPSDLERLRGRLWLADVGEHAVRRLSPSLPAR